MIVMVFVLVVKEGKCLEGMWIFVIVGILSRLKIFEDNDGGDVNFFLDYLWFFEVLIFNILGLCVIEYYYFCLFVSSGYGIVDGEGFESLCRCYVGMIGWGECEEGEGRKREIVIDYDVFE